jgi:GH25 family lysozyme M1 (1,4-beta-N-acetylmuramidase)
MRAKGIDISRYQAAYDPYLSNGQALDQPQHDFVYIKASEHTSVDARFEQHAGEIEPIAARGAYHYFRSLDIADPNFWRRQADFFLETVSPHGFDFLVLDFERTNNQPSMRFGAGAKAWIDYVAEESGVRVLLYTNPASYQEYLLQYGQRWMDGYPFICAQYPFRGWDDRLQGVYEGTWEPRLPAGQSSWRFWQFSADGNQKGPENGIRRMPWHLVPPSVDLNVFNGTRAELLAWLAFSGGEEPEPGWEVTWEQVDLERIELRVRHIS